MPIFFHCKTVVSDYNWRLSPFLSQAKSVLVIRCHSKSLSKILREELPDVNWFTLVSHSTTGMASVGAVYLSKKALLESALTSPKIFNIGGSFKMQNELWDTIADVIDAVSLPD